MSQRIDEDSELQNITDGTLDDEFYDAKEASTPPKVDAISYIQLSNFSGLSSQLVQNTSGTIYAIKCL